MSIITWAVYNLFQLVHKICFLSFLSKFLVAIFLPLPACLFSSWFSFLLNLFPWIHLSSLSSFFHLHICVTPPGSWGHLQTVIFRFFFTLYVLLILIPYIISLKVLPAQFLFHTHTHTLSLSFSLSLTLIHFSRPSFSLPSLTERLIMEIEMPWIFVHCEEGPNKAGVSFQ